MIRALLALVAFALIQDPPAPKPPEAKPAETKPQEKEKKKLTEAEEFLKKVEEKATKAKTLRCKAKMTMTEGGQEMELDIEASMAAEGKFKLSMEGEMMGKAVQVAVICDGKKMATEGEGPFGGRPKEPADAPKGAGEGMRLLFVRVGSITTMLMAEFRNKDDETELKDLFDVSDLKFGKEEKIKDRATKVLEYSLTFTGKQGGNNNTAEAKLWIDAETLAPVKREITGPRGETFTETFSDWKLDEELKDSLFELPKDK